MDSLFAKGTISIEEKQRIERLPDRRSAELVNVLFNCREPRAVAKFLEILSCSDEPAWKWIPDEVHKVAQEKLASMHPSSLGSRSLEPVNQDSFTVQTDHEWLVFI